MCIILSYKNYSNRTCHLHNFKHRGGAFLATTRTLVVKSARSTLVPTHVAPIGIETSYSELFFFPH